MATTRDRFGESGDRLLAATFVALTQLEIWVFHAADDLGLWLRVAVALLTVVMSLALAFRRTHPVLAYCVNTICILALIAVGYPSDFYQYTNLVATYSAAAHGTVRQGWAVLGVAVGGVLAYFVRFPDEGGRVIAAFVVATWVIGWLAGRMYGARVEESRLRIERDLSRRLAQTGEERLALEEARARIARELHDLIGHTVNVMVVHAGAGRTAIDSDVGAARQAFNTIEKTGRSALAELDRVLALLGDEDDDAELTPPPGTRDLADLAGTFAAAGLPTDLRVSGSQDSVPISVDLSAYRIVQEALTNTMKHGSASRAAVDVEITDERLTLVVQDDGKGDPDTIVAGRGIAGMRQRAALHGGTLDVRASAQGGISVTGILNWTA
ncbi:MAG: sensor histidine kinase [Euzebya sp.]